MRRAWAVLIRRGWWAVLLVALGAAVLVGRHVPDLRVRASTRALLDEDDPDLAYYESTRPLWGYDEYAMVCATRPDWITAEGIADLQALVADLRAVPHVASVASLLDVPLLRQRPGALFRPDQIVHLGDEGVDLEAARAELLAHTQAADNLVSRDGRDAGLLVYLEIPAAVLRLDPVWSRLQGERLRSAEARAELDRLRPEMDAATNELTAWREAMVTGVRAVARRWSARLTEPVRLSGLSIVNKNVVEHLRHDLRVFGVASLLLFLLGFAVTWRRVRFVLIPIVSCLVPVALVVGWMALRGKEVTVTTADLPLLLFVLMLPYPVYFVERYRERRARHPEEDGAASTIAAAGAVFEPCLYSCTTTMAGFLALVTSRTHPIRDFGWMMTVGMGLGLASVFLVAPSMSRPLPGLAPDAAATRGTARGVVRLFERLALARPVAVLVGAALLLAVAVVGATRLDAESKFTEYFWPSSEVHRGLEHIDRRLGGTTSLEIILTSPEKGFFLGAEGLAALAAVDRHFDGVPETGNVRSLATLVEELEKKSPAARSFLPVLARLDEVQPLLREYVADEDRVARVFVRMRETAPTLDRNRILGDLRRFLDSAPELAGVEARPTGIFLLYANMLNTLIASQRETFLFVLGAIWLMLLVLFRSPVLALLVLLPQVLPAVTMLGVMGWFGIPLDLVTVMIAAIAMGVGIDAAIQYAVRFRTELAVDGDRRAALRRSHATIGRAIWIATTVIVVGFCVLLLSDFRPSVWFGLFTALAMLMSQIAALTVLPAIFLVTGRPHAPAPAS